MLGHVARTGDLRYRYNILVAKPEGKGIPARHRRKWENLRLYLEEIVHRGSGLDSSGLG
jgi:hypothetical protein